MKDALELALARMDAKQPRDEKGQCAPTFSAKEMVPKASMKDFKNGDFDTTPFKKEIVNIADIHPSQSVVFREGVDKAQASHAAQASKGLTDYRRPSVVSVGGKLVATDGHHRIQAAHERGEKTIEVTLSRWT